MSSLTSLDGCEKYILAFRMKHRVYLQKPSEMTFRHEKGMKVSDEVNQNYHLPLIGFSHLVNRGSCVFL